MDNQLGRDRSDLFFNISPNFFQWYIRLQLVEKDYSHALESDYVLDHFRRRKHVF